jgi:lipopolysaccharide export system permease protein
MIILALPIAIMMAALMTLGKLGERNELAAMKSAGISLFRIIRPLVIFAVLMSGFSVYNAWVLIPDANLKLYSLIYDMKKAKPQFALRKGTFDTSLDQSTIYFADHNPQTGALLDIKIWRHDRTRGNYMIIYADSAKMTVNQEVQYLQLALYNGEQQELVEPQRDDPEGKPFSRTFFDSTYTNLDLSGFGMQRTNEDWFKSHRYMLTVPQLAKAIDTLKHKPEKVIDDLDQHLRASIRPKERLADSNRLEAPAAGLEPLFAGDTLNSLRLATLKRVQTQLRSSDSYLQYIQNRWYNEREEIQKHKTELHQKFALPTACIILLFIGAPLGAIIRKGGIGMPSVVALGFFVIFYSLMTFGKKMVEEEVVYAWFGNWLPVIIMVPMAIYLTYQSATDSRLFDISAWKTFFRRNSV